MTSTLTALGEELDLTEHEVFMAAVIATLTAERDAAWAEVARLKALDCDCYRTHDEWCTLTIQERRATR